MHQSTQKAIVFTRPDVQTHDLTKGEPETITSKRGQLIDRLYDLFGWKRMRPRAAPEGQVMPATEVLDEKPFSSSITRCGEEGGVRMDHVPGAMDVHIRELGSLGQQVIKYLGAAVVIGWNDLPIDVQRTLFKMATMDAQSDPASELPAEIARFLHNHKGDLTPTTSDRP